MISLFHFYYETYPHRDRSALVAARGPEAVRRARADNQFRADADQIAAIEKWLAGLTGKDIDALLSVR